MHALEEVPNFIRIRLFSIITYMQHALEDEDQIQLTSLLISILNLIQHASEDDDPD
jgi:hypothetical protein